MKKLSKFREPINVFPAALSAAEQDVFALVLCEISKVVGFNGIQAKQSDEFEKKPIPYQFEFTEAELTGLFQCSVDNLRKTLEPAARSLVRRDVSYSSDQGFDVFSPISRVRYHMGQPFFIEMSPSVAELLAENVEAGFSEMDFKLFVSLSGRYERRILKALSQWKHIPSKEVKFTIKEFRDYIGLEDGEYQRTEALVRKTIKKPISDIIEKSEGCWVPTDPEKKGFALTREGKGRAYTHVVFKMRHQPKAGLLQ
ncbi:replication initiation protein [Vibrio parahaemolyticus]|uniref:replication initiation protein n=1 Tax=Vibrio parahaemolyticus TaxID=670 RepID=UPI0003FAF50B|nr:replication initiation protein [Vibrio parahaemolyticus]HCE5184929.1 replication initiation protein [Vibrio parahaemolyticus]